MCIKICIEPPSLLFEGWLSIRLNYYICIVSLLLEFRGRRRGEIEKRGNDKFEKLEIDRTYFNHRAMEWRKKISKMEEEEIIHHH